jgi:RNA polymerase sigma-70 factor (ECF subfamily)
MLRAGRAVLVLRAVREGGVLRRREGPGLRMQVEAVVPDGLTPPGTVAESAWLDFRDRLRAFVARRVANPADVEDIVQFAFLQLHRGLGAIRNGERVHAWLYSTARRAIADYYRSRGRSLEVPSGDAADLDALAPTDSAEGDGDRRQEVARCLAPVLRRLAPADQEAILLTEVEGLRLAEAAARVNVSLPGMKSRVQRARRRLREAILACCHVALDGRGAPIGCERRHGSSAPLRQDCATERKC